MHRVKRISVVQTSLVAAIVLFFVTLIMILPMGLLFSLVGGMRSMGMPFGGGGLFFLAPFLYGIIGFISTAISCVIYNMVSKWTGGIEFELEATENNPNIG